ncbi:DNA/RNA non-specific endonuclease [Paraflavitalea pollutisoli]|uniref:DNA/RNA non-specific endonuclease n=1 Tax=Paraflavitalea pollutisoli TaxID=3034143 RepID=UPI0023EB0530|nr:DNA/RNA non-specific endonuclease [Paraflavitalea sp. H1-2-19X]
MLVPVEELDKAASRYDAWANQSGRTIAALAPEESLEVVAPSVLPAAKGSILSTGENMEKRKEMLEAISQEPAEFAFERAIGKNDSVYSNFIELIVDAKKKVGRIVVRQGNKNLGFATGFMVTDTLLLTNWHVFKTQDAVANSEVQFNYELDAHGRGKEPITFELDSATFFHTVKELDYCFVAVKPTDISGQVSLQSIGYIFLDPALGKVGNEGEESLNIIHHPDGDYKQLSIRENLFTRIMPTTIWYESDTAQGSSGSPVFNDQWQVVALHHMGIASRNAAGDYLDKDGKVLPLIDGKIDVARIHWIANEGIRTSVILKDIHAAFPEHPLIRQLSIGVSTGAVAAGGAIITTDGEKIGNGKVNSQEATNTTTADRAIQETSDSVSSNHPIMSNSENVHISFPASLIESRGHIQISISNGAAPAANGNATATVSTAAIGTPALSDELLQEIKKADVEKQMDFSACKGYQSRFLGPKFDIPIPQPQKSISKFIAKVSGSDGVVLKYHHYSLIFHSVRMMPIISAINVDGDPNKRKDDSKREDVWLRDNRIPLDIQLGDSFYKGSGFDRGHMSRREDANWGTTAADAKLFADMTCMYPNACPQINLLNQSSRKGLWGKLEKVVLEDGAVLERGRTAKISVFNGPIFKDSDPVFRGIQVPMAFYKIVLWINDDGDLKATAFKLSQEDLVEDIDFEAIDIDQNEEFAEYQVSIASLARETKLNFDDLQPFDTFIADNGHESIRLTSEDDVKTLVKRHRRK